MQSSFGIVKMQNNSCSSEFFGKDSNMKHLMITINKFPRAGMEKNAKDVTILYMLGRNTKATETKNKPGKKNIMATKFTLSSTSTPKMPRGLVHRKRINRGKHICQKM